jgi:hypothetical protein
MQQGHYCELNRSTDGHKIPYFFMTTKSSQLYSEGCITSPCPQTDDLIPTKLGLVHTNSTHSFEYKPQRQNFNIILLFILGIIQKKQRVKITVYYNVTACHLVSRWQHTATYGASYVPPNVGTCQPDYRASHLRCHINIYASLQEHSPI